MSKKWLRLFALLFAFTLVAAACGNDSDEGDAGDSTDSADTADDSADAADEGEDEMAEDEGDDEMAEDEGDDATDEAASDSTDDAGEPSGDGLVIGAVLPETGGLAFLGPPQIEGVQLAADDLAAAGANVTVISGDSGTDGAVAQETVGRLLGEGAQAIVGAASSSVTQDIIGNLSDSSIPQCSASNTSPVFSDQENADFYFRTVPPDEAVAPIIAQVVNDDGATKVAIVARADDYGNALATLVESELTGLGVDNTIVTYDPDNVASDAVVNDVAGFGADAVVLISFDEGIPVVQAALEAGVPADAMYGADGIFDNKLAEKVDPANASAINGFKVIGASGSAEFNDRLGPITDGNLIYGGQAYDCVILMALGFLQAGSADGDALLAAALEVSRDDGGDTTCTTYEECAELIEAGTPVNYDGVAGPLELDDVGDPTFGRYAIAEFQDGTLVGLDSKDVDLNF